MTQETSNVINLEDTFHLHGHSTKKRYVLKLSPTHLSITTISNETDIRLVPIDDIYGCLCMKSVHKTNQCLITFYVYALRPSRGLNGILSSKRTFHRSEHVFAYGKHDNFDANQAEIVRWHRHITQAIYSRRNLPSNRHFKA